MRVALDTDVIVAALRSRTGASHALLQQLRLGHLEAVASVPMVLEYEEMLLREEHREAIGMTAEEIGAFLDAFVALLRPILPYFLWRPLLRDPDDEMVLDAAVNGQVEAIVTFHVHDYLSAARQFHLEVLTPAAALQRLRRR